METPKQSLPPRPRRQATGTAHDRHGTRRVRRPLLSTTDRQRAIAVAAYFRAERRGFAAGGELADWLAAEREVDGDKESHCEHPDSRRTRQTASQRVQGS